VIVKWVNVGGKTKVLNQSSLKSLAVNTSSRIGRENFSSGAGEEKARTRNFVAEAKREVVFILES
jgi:hypothetical protein